jgi:serine/threonine protein kinase
MSDKDKELELIKLAQISADGKLQDETTPTSMENKLLEAFKLINKVSSSFKKASSNLQSSFSFKANDYWGPLKILDKIGEGGMGLVYLAYDSVLNREVAVKFLNQKSAEYISSDNFISEAQRIAKVRHPNVLAVFGATSYNNITGFWCDYINGDSLDQHIQKQISINEILKIANEITLAVEEVHKNEIIHGDIKPNNIMIDKHNNAILMDFGSGFDLQENQKLINSSTPLIMAPELFNGSPKTKASDIYALGVLFYFLSSDGQFPNNAKTLIELKSKLGTKASLNLSHLKGSKAWENLIARMLDLNTNQRPNIYQIKSTIAQILRAPFVRNKKIALYSTLTFLVTTTAILTYSYFSLQQQQQQTQVALKETSEVNSLMFNMLASVSPGMKGKDVLMVDVLDELINTTKNSSNITANNKAKTLFTLAHSLRNLGYAEKGNSLLDEISNYPSINNIIKVQIFNAKAEFELKLSHQQSSSQTAQEYLDKAYNIINLMPIKDLEVLAKLNYTQALIFDRTNQKDKSLIEANKALEYWNLQNPTQKVNRQKGLIYLLMGNLLSTKSLFKESLENYQLAETNFQSFDQKLNNNLLITKNNIAENYSQSGNTKKALEMYQELIKISKEFLGETHPDYLIYKLNLASALEDNNRPNEAIEVINEVLPAIIKQFGNTSMAYIIIQSTKAGALKSIKQYQQAQNIYQNLIEIASQQFGPNHPQVLLTEFNLAELYYESGFPQLCKDLLTQRLPIAQQDLGEKHTITLEMRQALAWSEFLLGNIDSAKQQIQDIVELKQQVYGVDNEVTETAIEMLKKMNTIKTINESLDKP